MSHTSGHIHTGSAGFLKAFALVTVICVAFAAIPFVEAAGDDTADLQSKINTAENTLTLDRNYNITGTVTIGKTLTLEGSGHEITYSGNGSAIEITGGTTVVLNNITIRAAATGAYGIAISSNTANVTIADSTIYSDTRGVNYYPVGGCTGKTLTIDNTDILNSRITDYDNATTVGDTRGIALYGFTNGLVKIIDGSMIKGFGYSVNTSGDLIDGVRAGGNTFIVTDSTIVGWSAFNVWTVKNTFTVVSSTLKGINDLDGEWNNFATFVVNDNIYDNQSDNANTVNIYGGALIAVASGTAHQTTFLESSESLTQLHFHKYGANKVSLQFPSGSGTFSVAYLGSTVNVTGIDNVTPAYSD